MDSQVDYVKKMKHALEDELRDTKRRVMDPDSPFESQSPNLSSALETEDLVTENEQNARKINRKRAKEVPRNFESKITSLVEEKFSLIQAEFKECIQEIHHLKDRITKGPETQRNINTSTIPSRLSSDPPKPTGTVLADYQSETKNIQAALSWSPLDDMLVLKKPFVVPSEDPKSGQQSDATAVRYCF
jgi:hypothetical protein